MNKLGKLFLLVIGVSSGIVVIILLAMVGTKSIATAAAADKAPINTDSPLIMQVNDTLPFTLTRAGSPLVVFSVPQGDEIKIVYYDDSVLPNYTDPETVEVMLAPGKFEGKFVVKLIRSKNGETAVIPWSIKY